MMDKAPDMADCERCGNLSPELAEKLMASGNFQDAAKIWAEIRKSNPEMWQGYVRGALALMGLRNFKLAGEIALKAIELFPDLYEAHLTYAEVARRAGQGSQTDALDRFAVLREKFPEKHHGYSLAARTCAEMEDFAQADTLCRLGMEKLPTEPGPFVIYAENAMRLKDYAEASRRYDLLLKKFPQLGYAAALAARPYIQQGDLKTAEAILKKGSERTPGAFEPLCVLAEICIYRGEYACAQKQLAKLMEKFPERAECYILLARAKAGAGDAAGCEASYVRGISLLPYSRELLLDYAQHLVEIKNYGEAERFIHTIFLARFPRDPEALSQLLRIRRLSSPDGGWDTDIFRFRDGMHSNSDAVQFISANFDSFEKMEEALDRQSFVPEKGAVIRKYQRQKIDLLDRIRRKYDFAVISLGDRCWTSTIFSRWGWNLQQEAFSPRLPFDLGGHPSATVLDLLENDFRDYARPENVTSLENRCDYAQFGLIDEIFDPVKKYYKNRIHGKVAFNHDPVENYRRPADFAAELAARVDRFRKTLGEKGKLYVHIDAAEPLDSQMIARFAKINFGEGNCLLLIDTSQHEMEKIAPRVYFMGMPEIAKISANHLNSLEVVASQPGFELESKIMDTASRIVEENFPRRAEYLSFEQVKEQARTAWHNEIFHSPRMTSWLESVKEKLGNAKNNGGIVMNCNPFTNGHKFLVETACREVDRLIIFVVEEDKSIFRFEDRYRLAQAACAEFDNVLVIPSGEFVASTTTAPDYFFKESESPVKFDGSRDLMFFGKYIAPALNIKIRFFGTEPHCVNTREYNSQAWDILLGYGLEMREIPRIEQNGAPVSARTVRKLMHEGKLEDVRGMVPPVVFEFLREYRSRPEYALYRL